MAKNSFTETSSRSWISRLGGSFKSILIGLVVLVGSIVLMWYNEGRAVKTAKGLEEGGASVVSIESNKIEPGNNGKLVHVTGRVETKDTLTDPQFGIKVNALKLKRDVEMYQWVQKTHRTTREKFGGGEETVTTYSYVKEWNSSTIKSSTFKEVHGHENPAQKPYADFSKNAQNVNLGKFKIPESILSKISGHYEFTFDNIDSTVTNAQLINDGVNTTIYVGEGTVAAPQIGDVKINYKIVSPGDHSIIAKQFNNTFERFKTSNGTTLEMVKSGSVSAENMFEAAIKGNKTLTWILRIVAIFIMFFAFKSILKPLDVIGDLIPFVGSIVSFGTSLAAGLTTVVLAFVVIALAWVFYRPILGISLLVIAGGVFAYMIANSRKRKALKKAASK